MTKKKSSNAVKGKQKKAADAVRKPAGKGKQKAAEKKAPEKRGKFRIITPDLMEEYTRAENEFYQKLEEEEQKRVAEFEQAKLEREEKRRAEFWAPGLVFNPSDELLVNHYLRNKTLGKYSLCPIEEVDVYGSHPKTLTEKYNPKDGVWYFFTLGRPLESPNAEGQWEFCGKNDVFDNGVKVGINQKLEFSDDNDSAIYKMTEYQLDPAPSTTAPLFMCKLYRLSV